VPSGDKSTLRPEITPLVFKRTTGTPRMRNAAAKSAATDTPLERHLPQRGGVEFLKVYYDECCVRSMLRIRHGCLRCGLPPVYGRDEADETPCFHRHLCKTTCRSCGPLRPRQLRDNRRCSLYGKRMENPGRRIAVKLTDSRRPHQNGPFSDLGWPCYNTGPTYHSAKSHRSSDHEANALHAYGRRTSVRI